MAVSKEQGNFWQERNVSLLREGEALFQIAECGGKDYLLSLFFIQSFLKRFLFIYF